MKKLYLFTANYPYGHIENFLEVEILFLSNVFDKIIIIPFSAGGADLTHRVVPENCSVLAPIRKRKIQYIWGLFEWKTFPLFIKDFFNRKVYANSKSLKKWAVTYIQTNIYFQSKTIKTLLNELSSDSVIYFYWGVVGNSILPFINVNAKKISRFHGEWDLWEESSGNYASIRKDIAEKLDMAVFISRKGESYFSARYPYCKTIVSKLGTMDNGFLDRNDKSVLRIVSCSYIVPIKRVPLIYNALQTIKNVEIEWTHIGGEGKSLDQLNELTKNNHQNLKVNLMGQISNSDVLNFYRNNKVHIFINLSMVEGIPVSIMEAISFNIPVIATDVGGTSEIVTSETGILLSENPSIQEIADAILLLSKKNLSPRTFWTKEYNAEKNYTEFAKLLISI